MFIQVHWDQLHTCLFNKYEVCLIWTKKKKTCKNNKYVPKEEYFKHYINTIFEKQTS